jgi:hypothetical protein
MNKMQIYVHSENNREPKLVEVAENASVADLIGMYQNELTVAGSADGINLFIEDEDEPKAKDAAGEKHGLKKRVHVHCHRCKKVSVAVGYNGDTKSLSFPPSTTVKKVMKKVVKEFGIEEADAGDYLLKLEEGTVLQPADHIGSFASHPHCQVKFFLTPTKPIQG